MIDEIPFEKILRTAMRYGADYADVFAERTRRTSVVCDNHRLEQASTAFDAGIGIRVISDGRAAYGSTNSTTHRDLLDLARSVGRQARAKRRKSETIQFRENQAPSVATVRKHPFGISLDEKCATVLRADEVAWKMGDAIRQARISYRDTVRRIWIANSAGWAVSDEQVDILFIAQVIAGNELGLQTGFERVAGTMGFEIFEDMPPEAVAESAAGRAIKMLTARPAPAGMMPVILAAEAGGTMIHEAVGHGLEADLAGEGLSVYSGKIGQKVASSLVTVIDDATLPGKRGSFTFDDEGTPAHRTVLIDHGVLVSYMSNRKTAEGMGRPSTGNGRRQSYEYQPIVRMTNTIIAPGNDDPAAILKGTPSGLFVRRMGGGQVNTVNGNFVFDVQEGYLIENGKIGEPVRGANLVGNGPKVLAEIDRVGNNLGFSIGTCGKDGQETPVSCGQPTIRIPEITVGGTSLGERK